MTSHLVLSLITPLVSGLLAASFLTIGLHLRRRPYTLYLAASFAAVGCGFLIQDFVPYGEWGVSRLFSNTLFLVAVLGIISAPLKRRNVAIPVRLFAAISCIGMAVFCWYLFVDPVVENRIHTISIMFSALLSVKFVYLYRYRHASVADALILAASAAALLNFMMRPAFLLLSDHLLTPANFQDSIYWTSTQVTSVALLVAIALSFLVSVALELMEDLRNESRTDILSGLLNRRGFEEVAHRDYDLGCAAGEPSALIVADLDRFKHVNDQYGHAAGDRVIQVFARTMRAETARRAVIGRVGGEEFAIFLPRCGLAEARQIAESLRTAFARQPVDGLPAGLRFTASFGICEAGHEESFLELTERTDRALYDAKRGGRNRTCASVHVAVQNPDLPATAEPPPASAMTLRNRAL